MAGTLLITNGDSAVAQMRAAGFEAVILPWRDALHEGPVPVAAPDELAGIRASFLADAFGGDAREVREGISARDRELERHGEFPRVEIWLEHDLYDQLQLIQILDRLAALGRTEDVWLIQADDYLGRQGPEALRACAAWSAPCTPAQFGLARRAWAAFTSATPVPWTEMLEADRAILPFLGAAFRRLLAELPAPVTGLNLTEARIISVVSEDPSRPARVFAAVAEQEEAQFMGDASFFRCLDELAFAREPLLGALPHRFPVGRGTAAYDDPAGRAYLGAELNLTGFGAEVLAGRADHATRNGIDRWLGGVHLAKDALWRWDRNDARLSRT